MRPRLWPVPVLAVVAVLVGGCGGGSEGGAGAGPDPTTTTTTTPAPTTAAPDTTTAAPPPAAVAPRPTPAQAASAFVAAWAAGDRNGALAVASLAAVDALFVHPPVAVEDRGCSAPLSDTSDCAYGIGRQGILVVSTRNAPGGWLVSGASYNT